MSSDTLDIIKRLAEPFPREAIKSRQGGGNTRLSYVEAHTVIRRLNAATGGHWDFAVLREEQTGDLLKATCRLTIPGLGSREHVGVQKVSERGGEDLHKGAISDALKKCATLFGVGLELYGEAYEDDDRDDAPPPPRRAEAARPAPAATTPPAPPQGQPAALPTPDDGLPEYLRALAADDPLAAVLATLRAMETRREPWANIKLFADTQGEEANDYGKTAIADTLHAIAARRKAAAPAAPTFASRAG